jgi:hypothetical protein
MVKIFERLYAVSSISGPLGAIPSFLLSRQVIRFRGQRLKRRLVALFLVSRSRHWGGVGAKIDLNESIDSSVNAFCHAWKIGPQSPISNGNQIAHSNSNIVQMLPILVKTVDN